MVYGNYDPAYIRPNCDLCGDFLDEIDLRLEFETVNKDSEGQVDVHEGHLCESCNELDFDDPEARPFRVEYHFIGGDPCELLMIDIRGAYGDSSEKRSLRKYTDENAPEFLRNRICSRSAEYRCPESTCRKPSDKGYA